MKKVQRINESQLRAIVAESVKKVLNENIYPRVNSNSYIENELSQIESAYESLCDKEERGIVKLNTKAMKMIYNGLYNLEK